MFGSLIISAILLSLLIGGIGVAAFMWLNARDSSLDDRTYEKNYCVKKDISRQYIHRGETREIADPGAVLQRYSMKESKKETEPKVKILAPSSPFKLSSNQDDDIVEAEIIEDSSSA